MFQMSVFQMWANIKATLGSRVVQGRSNICQPKIDLTTYNNQGGYNFVATTIATKKNVSFVLSCQNKQCSWAINL